MRLKLATLLAAICLSIVLVERVIFWTLVTFDLLEYSDFLWLFDALDIVGILLESGSLIVFFLVLHSKQTG